MSFGDRDNEILAWAETSLAEMDSQLPTVTIPVERPIETAADYWGAVEDARALHKITDEEYALALDFFGRFFTGEDRNKLIGGLNYVDGVDGLELILDDPNIDRMED